MEAETILARLTSLALATLLLVGCVACQSAATPEPPTAAPVEPTATPVPLTPTPAPSLAPSPRGYHLMAYDTESDRVILFDGCVNPEECLNETWAYEFDSATWSQMSPPRSPAGYGPMAYDVESDRMVLYIGATMSSAGELLPAGETWAYDFNSDIWTDMEPAEVPVGLLGAEMVYDAESDRMVMFGGLDPESFATRNDTWTYDLDSNTWTKMEPAVGPSARNYSAMAYHEGSDRVILFGGYTHLKDTWAYDYNAGAWEELEPAEAPSARMYCDMVYDPSSGKMMLFGGATSNTESSLDDTWAYDYGIDTWTELAPEVHPSKRGWYAAVYSTKPERVILFGGGPNRYQYTAETWIYDPEANTWSDATLRP